MIDKLQDKCGVFGIYSNGSTNVVSACYYALFALQHRGETSCGIAINSDGIMTCHTGSGQVGEVFTHARLSSMPNGEIAIGHVLYGDQSTTFELQAQPLVVRHINGSMALAFNGCITNASELRESLELRGSIFQTSSDAEVISHIIVQERLSSSSIEQAVSHAMEKLEGAYTLAIMSPTKLIAARDKRGMRPLCIGSIDGSTVISSETCALSSIGAKFERDVAPGEIVVIDSAGIRSITDHCGTAAKSLCVFEFIYTARPDSVVDGCSVHLARQQAGMFLAEEHPVDADIVIGVPDSGIDAAIGYARRSGIPYGIGFIKNKYIGRTFIHPTQSDREDKVRIKLNVIENVVRGKRIVLIDDSIVRGTTSARTIKLLREAGVKEIHMRVSSPPFLFPCYYGTDIDSPEKLIANHHTAEEIAEIIGVDSLGYLSCENLKHIANAGGFCDACFTGNYPLEVTQPTKKPIYMRKLSEREASAK